MSLRENQAKEIAEWVVTKVGREDFDELVRELPGEIQKAYTKRNTLKHQPTSTWRHYRNWWLYRISDWDFLFVGFFLVWAMPIAAFLGAYYGASLANITDQLNMPWAIMVVSLDALITQIIPRIVILVCWKKWHSTHPISLRPYWTAENYLK